MIFICLPVILLMMKRLYGKTATGSSKRLQATGFRLQASGYRLQATGFRLQASGFRLQASGYRNLVKCRYAGQPISPWRGAHF
jgi:hypothetical protein